MKLTKSLYKSCPDFLAKREKNRGACLLYTSLMAQLDAWAEEYRTGKNEEFQGWFDTIKNQLTDNVAGSLQAQINQITESKGQPLSLIHI